MKILSIHDGHNASAAIFEDHKILAAVSEERLNREKFYWGWPERSIEKVLQVTGLSLKDIEVVTVSHLNTWRYALRKIVTLENYTLRPKFLLGHLYHIYITFKRELKIKKLAWGHGVKKFFFCDHHLAHAASAYYYSGFKEALVVTIDAQGDGLSHTVYKVKKGKWELLVRDGSNGSLGAFYAALTEGLGFKPNRHEGKIVGLAALGDPKKISNTHDSFFVGISSDKLHFKRQGYFKMVEKVRELLKNFSREDIAAYGQELLERIIVNHICHLQFSGLENLALAGGVFSNVKLNQKIAERCGFKQIFIQPAMGDEGLVLGSAAYYIDHWGGGFENKPLNHVYLGPSFPDEEIETALREKGYIYQEQKNLPTVVAEKLNEGKIVGWFDGRMEFGPRALGARSMMANPKRKEINDELNKRLKRSEFMPFAPSVLAEKADDIFSNVSSSRHPAEFMTITYNVNPRWRERIKAVVHVDGTARPQLVKRDNNPAYYSVIEEFFKLTGIPLVVNTSYNMHEEPIVCSPQDALRAFDVGAVDCIIFNNRFLVERTCSEKSK